MWGTSVGLSQEHTGKKIRTLSGLVQGGNGSDEKNTERKPKSPTKVEVGGDLNVKKKGPQSSVDFESGPPAFEELWLKEQRKNNKGRVFTVNSQGPH